MIGNFRDCQTDRIGVLGDELFLSAIQVVAEVEHKHLRTEEFARSVRGAIVAATTAFRARVKVADGFPMHVFDSPDANGVLKGVNLIGGRPYQLHELLAGGSHRGELPSGRKGTEKHIRNSGDDVEMF